MTWDKEKILEIIFMKTYKYKHMADTNTVDRNKK